MRCLAVLLTAVLTLCPRPVAADATLALGWQGCLSGGGFANQAFGCGSTTNQIPLVPSFTLEQPVDSVYSLELVIDLVHSVDPLPPWWRMDPGQCREGQIIADADLATSGCSDPWQSLGAAVVQGYTANQPFGASNHARILVAVVVPSDQARSLLAGVDYAACRVLIKSGNTNICTGCSEGACLVLNSIQLHRLPGSSFEEVVISSAAPSGSNWARWQGGAGADCATVPVRRRTWGAIKALYR